MYNDIMVFKKKAGKPHFGSYGKKNLKTDFSKNRVSKFKILKFQFSNDSISFKWVYSC